MYDLVLLSTVSEDSVLSNLSTMYFNDMIYVGALGKQRLFRSVPSACFSLALSSFYL